MSKLNLSTIIDMFDNLNLYAFVFNTDFNILWENAYSKADPQCFSTISNIKTSFFTQHNKTIETFFNNSLNSNLSIEFEHASKKFNAEIKFTFEDNGTKYFLCLFNQVSNPSRNKFSSLQQNYFSVHRDYLSNIYVCLEALGLKLNINDDADLIPFIDNALTNCKKMYKDIINFNEYSKITSEKATLSCKPVIVKLLLSNLIDKINSLTTNCNIVLTVTDSSEILASNIDVDRLTIAFLNIFINSIKFGFEQTNINVQLSKFEDKICITITDDGIGMDENTAANAFQPFFSFNPSSAKPCGIGLGLAVTKEIIEKHGGVIRIFSVLNKGTKIIIHLPCVDISSTQLSSPKISDKNHKLSLFNVFMSDVYEFVSY